MTSLPAGSEAIQIVLALLAVVVLIILVAWFVRRFSGLGQAHGKPLRVVAAISVGNRERIAVIDVGGRQILVGITSQHISSLMQLDEPIDMSKGDGEFARNLQNLLRRSQNDVKGELDELR